MLSGCFRKHISGMELPARRRARNGVKRGPRPVDRMFTSIPAKSSPLFRMLKSNTHPTPSILISLHHIQACLRFVSILLAIVPCPCLILRSRWEVINQWHCGGSPCSCFWLYHSKFQIPIFILCYHSVNSIVLNVYGAIKTLLIYCRKVT